MGIARAYRALGLAVLLLWSATGPVLAARGTVSGAEHAGFGRIVITFDQDVKARIRLVNAVMVIEFDEAIDVDPEKLSQQLPNYISAARLDPEGKGLRLALSDKLRPDLKSAGEKIFIDLLPPKWQGLPPGLPKEVVDALYQRARTAEKALASREREAGRVISGDVTLEASASARFQRVVFRLPALTKVEQSEAEGAVTLDFNAGFRLSQRDVRSKLAGFAEDIRVEGEGTRLMLRLRPKAGFEIKGFAEDDGYTLDFIRLDSRDPATTGAIDSRRAEPDQGAQVPPRASPLPIPGAPLSEAGEGLVPGGDKKTVAGPDKFGPAHPNGAPKTAEQARIAATSAVSLHVDAGEKAGEMTVRLNRIKDLPLALFERNGFLVGLIETTDILPDFEIAPALAGRVGVIAMTRLPNATLFRVPMGGDPLTPLWLEKVGDDLLVRRTAPMRGRELLPPEGLLQRQFDARGRDALLVRTGEQGALYRLDDPATGVKIAVVPVPGARMATPKRLGYAQFSIEPSLVGLVLMPLDDSLRLRRAAEGVQIAHESQLTLSPTPSAQISVQHPPSVRSMFDFARWREDQKLPFQKTANALIRVAAEAVRSGQSDARLRLAQFYLAHEFYPEAHAVLDILAQQDPEAANTRQALAARALADLMTGRLVEAARLLAHPVLDQEPEQKLLQALVDAKAGRYPLALERLRQSIGMLSTFPDSLERPMRLLVTEAAIEAQDATFAREQLRLMQSEARQERDFLRESLLEGKIALLQDRAGDAFVAFERALASKNQEISIQARLGMALSGPKAGAMSPAEAQAEFETLALIWRRDEVELKALEHLGQAHLKAARWREAFGTVRRALDIAPDHPVARRIEERMAGQFEALFLEENGATLSHKDAVSILNEFRFLVPPGPRGDQIAQRLGERFADLGLVNEAAVIFDHQVKHRLQGASKSILAAKLALMYLQARKPEQAIAVLRQTRLASLPEQTLQARLMLEARALAELQQIELAMDVIAGLAGAEVDRLRADILWLGKRWRQAGEAYERLLGEGWREPERQALLEPEQRFAALRAGIAYVLGDEHLSRDRLRGRYLALMAKTPDGKAFDVISSPSPVATSKLREAAGDVVSADTMTDFIASYRKRFWNTSPKAQNSTSSLPATRG